jgi:hypothetical protein
MLEAIITNGCGECKKRPEISQGIKSQAEIGSTLKHTGRINIGAGELVMRRDFLECNSTWIDRGGHFGGQPKH